MNWQIINKYPKDLIAAIAKSRGIKNFDNFVNPDFGALVDPFLIPGMKKGVKRIQTAIKNNEKIGIFMDYDADGIPGGAIIYKALTKFTKNVFTHVPLREDGYGLNISAIDNFKNNGVSLLITVDCGIKNIKEVAHAKKSGIDIIITDHHTLGDDLPEADVIIHPLIEQKNKLKFKDFSGGGVAFMLAKALLKNDGQEKWLLDLAAISSIADIVTLRDDNRLIVKYGLVVLNKTRNLGLKTLIDVAKINWGNIGTYEVGYLIAPRINAAGRISSPQKSFQLLITEDKNEAKKLAQELDSLNAERQEILTSAQKSAEQTVREKKLYENKLILLHNFAWPEGIIGLIAGKIAQQYYCPTIVLNERAGKMKGSARSIAGINITQLIGKSEKYLLSFGGHEQAAGLSLESKNLEKFEKSILNNAQKFPSNLYEKTLKIDALAEPKQINLTLARQMEKLEPFGPGNYRPVIGLEEMRIVSLRQVGRDGKHLHLEVAKSGEKQDSHRLIAFNYEANGWKIERGDIVDLAFSVKLGEFNGQQKLDLILEDIKKVNGD